MKQAQGHAVRDPRGGLIPLPLPDQHPAPREVAAQAHLHLEGGSELFCLLVHYLLVVVVMARLDQLGYQLNEGVRSEVVGMVILVLDQGYSQEVRTTFGTIFLL